MHPINFSHLIEEEAGNSIFYLERIWNDPDLLPEKYILFLSPDSNVYCSRINPVFSFQLKDHNLRYTNLLSLRDGVYPLLRFFAMNPAPQALDCNLVIEAELASLVPKSWRHKVFLRKLYVETPTFPKKENECLILISPDQDSLPLNVFEKELAKLETQLKKFKKIQIYFSNCILRGEEEADESSNRSSLLLNRLLKFFVGTEIEILDWAGYKRLNASQLTFVFMNPLKFYFTDSFLQHDLLQRGAVPLSNDSIKISNAHYEKISINHGYQIYPWEGPEGSLFEDDFKKFFFDQDINVKLQNDDFRLVKLTIPAFKAFGVDVAHKIYNT